VISVDLPTVSHASATMHDDADYVRGALDSVSGDVVLVGHSYGGVVITEAGVHPNVKRLVYLTAFALDVGESASQNALLDTGHMGALTDAIVFAEAPTGEAVLTIAPEGADAALYHDCTAEVASAAVDRLRPQPLASLTDTVLVAAWRTKPATYVVCTDDRAIPVAAQRSAAARATTSLDWPTSHSPFSSRPELVADLLIDLSAR